MLCLFGSGVGAEVDSQGRAQIEDGQIGARSPELAPAPESEKRHIRASTAKFQAHFRVAPALGLRASSVCVDTHGARPPRDAAAETEKRAPSKETIGRPVIAGDVGMAITLTEPQGGSDLANIRTTATKSADGRVCVGRASGGMVVAPYALLRTSTPALSADPLRCAPRLCLVDLLPVSFEKDDPTFNQMRPPRRQWSRIREVASGGRPVVGGQ